MMLHLRYMFFTFVFELSYVLLHMCYMLLLSLDTI